MAPPLKALGDRTKEIMNIPSTRFHHCYQSYFSNYQWEDGNFLLRDLRKDLEIYMDRGAAKVREAEYFEHTVLHYGPLDVLQIKGDNGCHNTL